MNKNNIQIIKSNYNKCKRKLLLTIPLVMYLMRYHFSGVITWKQILDFLPFLLTMNNDQIFLCQRSPCCLFLEP